MKLISEYLETNPTFVQAVVAFIIDKKNNKVLLGVRKSSSTNLGVGKKCGIGGKLNKIDGIFETPEQALIRETQEEVNIIPTEYQYRGKVTYLNPFDPKRDMVVYEFVVTEWEGDVCESDEILPIWFSINEIPVNEMFIDNKYFVPQLILTDLTIEATFLFVNTEIEDMFIKLTTPNEH